MKKVCKCCKKELNVEEFAKSGKSYRSECKKCLSAKKFVIEDNESIADYGKRMVPSIDTAQRAIARFCLECGTGTFGSYCDECPLNAFSPRKCANVMELHKLLK